MLFERRQFVMAIGAVALGVPAASSGQSKMYGLIGKMRTQPGQRDALIAILLAGAGSMHGCLSYVVAKDPADADGIWISSPNTSSKQGITQPPNLKPFVGSSHGPPDACITPSMETWAPTIIFRTVALLVESRMNHPHPIRHVRINLETLQVRRPA